jgi:hypothetical protein
LVSFASKPVSDHVEEILMIGFEIRAAIADQPSVLVKKLLDL